MEHALQYFAEVAKPGLRGLFDERLAQQHLDNVLLAKRDKALSGNGQGSSLAQTAPRG
jgi:hypothetical protein